LAAGLAYPAPGSRLRLPWGKCQPLRALGYDADRLQIVCTYRDERGSGCSSIERIKLPAKLLYEWEITGLQRSGPRSGPKAPFQVPRGGFKERRCTEIGPRDTGEQVLFYHPYLDNVGDRATVTIKVTVRDDAEYNAPKPADAAVEFNVRLNFRRVSLEELEVFVQGPAAPGAPDMRPEIASVECPCQISTVWENPAPIDARLLGQPDVIACGEMLKLRATGGDRDKLVIWCEGRECQNSVQELVLSDPLRYEWSASAGSFPAGNAGENVVYQAPRTPQTVQFRLTVYDSGAQFPDDPKVIDFTAEVKRHPVVMVPGLLASTLELDGKLIWPPAKADSAYYFATDWSRLILNEDGTDPQNVTSSAMLDDAEMYGMDCYGVMRRALERANHDTFGVPYDWRRHLARTAGFLNRRVAEALQRTGFPKVSIVCHSMGGLVSRQWLHHHGGASKVDKVVFVATPHHGASKAYRYLRWGEEVQVGFADDTLMALITGISFGKPSQLFRSWPSFYHLLPTKDFFSGYGGFVNDEYGPSKEGWLPNWPRTYSANPDARLEKQHHVAEAERFHDALPETLPAGIKRYNVFADDQDTERLYTYGEAPVAGLFDGLIGGIAKWAASKIVSAFSSGPKTTVHGEGDAAIYVNYLDGDLTVPTPSARWQFGSPQWDHQYRVTGVVHSKLTNAEKTVYYALYWFENLS
jgi:pimeloyl-ACP methyl ester carboxylesterase